MEIKEMKNIIADAFLKIGGRNNSILDTVEE